MNSPVILVVDDEPRNFDVIESFLSHENYELNYASSGEEALESLNLMPIDLILLDVMMPEMDGLEACSLIKVNPQWQSIPIIMVTALTAKEDLARCLNTGADDFISKPVNSLELRARVNSMLRIKQQYDEIQIGLQRQAILEAEKIEILENRNIELEKQVAARTASLRATAEVITHNALHDPLTDLPNRRMLLERLELAINKAKQVDSYNYAVLFLDLDKFKVINDSLGHLIGDQLLIKIAENLNNHLQEIYLVTRFGGDEFVILLEYINGIEEIIKITEGILKNFQYPIKLNEYEKEMVVSASIGIVWETKDYSRAADLIRDADIAMYKAKSQGRNSYYIFDAEMHTQAVNRLTLENDLRKALEREEFIVYYQPIMDIQNNILMGFEALVRWQHPTRGFISPIEFISISEDTGLIVSIDTWMFKAVCQQLAIWKNKFPHRFPLKMTINLSAQDIRKASLMEDIDHTLAETGLDGNSITLEITESRLIEDLPQTIDLLTKLKERNIQISIDDFGTGYSSLNYLHRLPANYLKIDRSFVKEMQEENRNYQMISTIINLSNQLGLKVVAEGIETIEQLQWLQQLKCEFGQGYLFSKPLPVQEIEEKFLIGKKERI
ncbi:two-component system response regulator [Aphanothece sacrum]|uniref:Diguanylate phosphodiesterase n=1 Tax=Aphanothece sacrum FPU1 TaxID=1920663 RepID=A0A401IC84_APHSA|nr:EAL domain-containing protein [Aphanothece sacrum]GBF78903.1 diguanylate phosphodiesterase [Aphanothece sacrum FPU1]GBF83134.1 diguanylate phosphodiesterase [Aphanothece sacrum FPU3]